GLALLQSGDMVRIDLNTCSADMLVPLDELAKRARDLLAAGGYGVPESQTPWQELFREKVGRFDEGMILDGSDKYQDIARKSMPRDSH
ncbi:MAG: dihydroxy-acid dehydratase, partial [Sulfitobacter sp.]